MKKILATIQEKFSAPEGGKRVANHNKIVAFLLAFVCLCILGALVFHYFRDSTGSDPEPPEPPPVENSAKDDNTSTLGGITPYRERTEAVRTGRRATSRRHNAPAINYHAPQVMVRPTENHATGGDFLAMEGRFIGRIATPVNTKEGGRVEVVLPYGGGRLPPKSTLFGEARYPGEGEKVFVRFHRGRTPDGQGFSLNARALSAVDYSMGLVGRRHSGGFGRTAAVLGLSMASGVADVLTQKQVLGRGEIVTPKSTMSNALYHGTAKVTGMLAQEKAQDVQKGPPYIILEAGEACIVEFFSRRNE